MVHSSSSGPQVAEASPSFFRATTVHLGPCLPEVGAGKGSVKSTQLAGIADEAGVLGTPRTGRYCRLRWRESSRWAAPMRSRRSVVAVVGVVLLRGASPARQYYCTVCGGGIVGRPPRAPTDRCCRSFRAMCTVHDGGEASAATKRTTGGGGDAVERPGARRAGENIVGSHVTRWGGTSQSFRYSSTTMESIKATVWLSRSVPPVAAGAKETGGDDFFRKPCGVGCTACN